MATNFICSVDDCGKAACNSRGWCWSHYQRWRKHGDPLAGRTYMHRLDGLKFGKLTAISPIKKDGKRYWACVCDCGAERSVETEKLINGNTKSCGQCIRFGNKRAHKHGNRPKAGATSTYNSWESMKKRVSSKVGYEHVDMDPRWASFSEFLADMGERPDGLTIDRKDNSLGYWKDNCRWANKETQSRNRRIAVTVEVDGRDTPVAEWAKTEGISYGAAYARLRRLGRLKGGYIAY